MQNNSTHAMFPGATHDEQVGHYIAASEAVTEYGKGALEVSAAHQNPASVGHAAVRSWAER